MQGLGGGGLSILPAMVVCDLVPLRERQKYTSIVYGSFAIGTFIGPVVGGALVDHAGWRWIFWINLPIAGTALALVTFVMKLRHNRTQPIMKQLRRIDILGNLWLMASVTAILLALSGTGPTQSWRSWQTLLPLLLGSLGLPCFVAFEASPWCAEPTTPLRLFKNRTSLVAFLLTFLHGITLYWVSYYIPVYFQAIKLSSPLRSGVNTLAAAIPLVPFGMVGAVVIAKTGCYKAINIAGFAISAIGIGCFSLLRQSSSTAEWVILLIVFALGAGIVLTALLPAIQAPLPESDAAVSTATWGFVQSLGFIYGVAIPSSIFEARFGDSLSLVQDPAVRQAISVGGAYTHATREFLSSLPEAAREQLVQVYVESLRTVWEAGSAFAIAGCLAAFLLRKVRLRETLETEYGLEEAGCSELS